MKECGVCECAANFNNVRLIKSAMNKVCSNIEQKGVAQLLQIEEVRLKSSRRCGFSQSPHAQEASIFLVFYTV